MRRRAGLTLWAPGVSRQPIRLADGVLDGRALFVACVPDAGLLRSAARSLGMAPDGPDQQASWQPCRHVALALSHRDEIPETGRNDKILAHGLGVIKA